MPDSRVAAVILAAGASARLGEPKQLVRLGGETLIGRTARLAAEAGCSPVVVVVGHEAEAMRRALADSGAQMIENADWQEGMGSSLRAGMRAVEDADPAAVLLLVCDQLRLTAEHLRELLALHASGDAPITASEYGGRAGVPAVFAREVFPELLALQGDQGAREVIRREPRRVRITAWPEGSFDLDTPEDRRWLTGMREESGG